MRFDVAADHQAQAVGDEVHQVMVRQHLRVLVEQIAGGRVVHVRFQRDEALAPRLVQQFVHQGQHVQVVARLVLVALEHRGDAGEGRLHHLGRIAHQERTQRGAADDHQFERLPERGEFSVRGDEAAQHAGDDDQDSDDDEHGVAWRGVRRNVGPGPGFLSGRLSAGVIRSNAIRRAAAASGRPPGWTGRTGPAPPMPRRDDRQTAGRAGSCRRCLPPGSAAAAAR